MVEFVGLIKVNIIRGTNLVVRDMVTSDPYVVLSLGNQVNYLSYIIHQLQPACKSLWLWECNAVDEDAGDKEQHQPGMEWMSDVVDSRTHTSSEVGKFVFLEWLVLLV